MKTRMLLPGALVVGLALVLAACTPQGAPLPIEGTPEGTAPPADSPAQGVEPPAPTPLPTEVTREFRTYRHPSGVFGLTIPADWEILDASNDNRLLVRAIPPIGYGSRITVEVTNEGPLSPAEVQALAESYVHLHYTSQPGYTEISRSELPDGRLQFVFLYNDGRGAEGRLTLLVRQAGPYFTALQAFLSDKDAYNLSSALDAILASFSADALAVWSSAVAAINPAELLIVNTALWRDAAGLTYYTGEVYNASPAGISAVQARVALCSPAGVVMADITQPAALSVVQPGGSTPFALTAGRLPEDVTVCAQQASASPAPPAPDYTTALVIETSAGFNAGQQLVLSGRVANPGLAPLSEVEVVLLVYDAEGRVIGYHLIALGPDVELAPGESRPFSHTFSALGGTASRFVSLGQARVVTRYNPSLAPSAGEG